MQAMHAEEMFKDVTEAYNVLSDEKKRKLYDEFGFAGLQEGFSEEAARQAAQGGFGGFGGNSPFSGSYSSNGGPFTHQEFHLRTAPGIWMIFSQCSEICFHMVAAPEVVARTAQVVQGASVETVQIGATSQVVQRGDVHRAARVLMLWLPYDFI